MKMMKCLTTHLCEELVIEILSRLPAKSLVRSMAVCRLWKSIITGPQFRLDSKRPSKVLLLTNGECYSVVEEDENLVMLEADFPLKHYSYDRAHLIGCDGGLLCIGIMMENSKFHCQIVWNPCIRKHVVIPDHPTNDHKILYALGFGATTSDIDYKYVRIVGFKHRVNKYTYVKAIETYSLKTETWRRKYLDYVCYVSTDFWGTPVVLRGRLHWIGHDRTKINPFFIFSFDLEDEAVEQIMIPECMSTRSCEIFPRLLMVKESLGLLANEQGKRSTVWVMEVYGDVHSWIKLCYIEPLMGKFPRSLFHFLKNGEFLLDLGTVGLYMDYPLNLTTYNPKTGKTRDFGGLSPSSSFCGFVNNYKESLVLFGNDHRAVADHKVLSISEQSVVEAHSGIWYPLISILSLSTYFGNAPTSSAGSIWLWAFLLGVSIIYNQPTPVQASNITCDSGLNL